ncbi:MAG: hypothetical protein O7C59_12305, partial [Rickettsia endosymbiont of Ixodes persulcatus]|nr:hypothetical protein [Rickettsia endosymbiont of Ixodes persulcatus]
MQYEAASTPKWRCKLYNIILFIYVKVEGDGGAGPLRKARQDSKRVDYIWLNVCIDHVLFGEIKKLLSIGIELSKYPFI